MYPHMHDLFIGQIPEKQYLLAQFLCFLNFKNIFHEDNFPF